MYLRCPHSINDSFDDVDFDEVPSSVEHDAPVPELGPVLGHIKIAEHDECLVQDVILHRLEEGLNGVASTKIILGTDCDLDHVIALIQDPGIGSYGN